MFDENAFDSNSFATELKKLIYVVFRMVFARPHFVLKDPIPTFSLTRMKEKITIR